MPQRYASRFSAAKLPRSFPAGLHSRTDPSSLYICLGFLRPKCKPLHFAVLNLIRFTRAQLSSLLTPLNGIPSFLLSSVNLLRVHSIPSSMLLMKMLKSTGPKTDPWGTPLVTSLHLDIEPSVTTLSVTFQPVPHPPGGPPIKSTSLQFGDKLESSPCCL